MSSAVVGSAEFLLKVKDMVTGPMRSIGANVTSTLKSIGSIAAGNLLASGIQRAAAAARDFLSQGISANAEFDKLNNTFTTMLGSQRKASALMADLQKFAATTPFEMAGLAQNTAALLATKQVGQSEIIPMLKKLGDAAAGSTEGFAAMPRVVRAISQMLSKGKLQAEEMMQLAEAGIPAWSALADKMGKSTGEVQKMAQQGKLGIKEIMLLVDGLGAKYAGLAQKQSRTFDGLSSTIADNVSMALAKVTRPIYDRLTKVMASVVDAMDAGKFSAIIDKITAGVSFIIESFDKLASSPLTKTVVQIAAIAAGFIAAGAALAWVPTLVGLAVSLAPTVAAITAISAAAAGLAVLFRNAFAGPDGEKFRAKLAEIWALIKEIGLNIRDGLTAGLKAASDMMARLFGQTGGLQQSFNGLLNSSLDWIRGMLDNLTILTANWDKSWEYMKVKGYAAILWLGDQLIYTLNERVPFALAALVEGAIAGGREIVNQWKVLFDGLFQFIGDMFDVWYEHQKARLVALINASKQVAKGRLGDALKVLVEGVGKADQNALTGTAAAGAKFAAAVAPAVNQIGAKIREAMNGVMQAMPGFKPSDATRGAMNQAEKLWDQMRQARNAKRADRFIEGLGLEQVPAKIGGFLGDLFAKGGMGFFGGVEDMLGIFGKKPADEENKKKAAKSEFVGLAEMNKKIQMSLGKEDKNAKAQLKAVQQGAKAAEKGAAMGEAIVEGVKGVKDAVGKIVLGFAK